ncbi:MAG: 3-isopropylmalate dehydratase small subunit [Micavibrio aeruginosavorus]|uniref:3-isopropylmalate dehydratase small subunit n=1 Tax=Micavibrio aeruginosavorus TaxID=349221 RepID=A0A7T5R1E5_9BACT|nr:MAG: 3-isopropylmalate dehydratase small subunit [Micavibrio aeruginosavorus]
MKAFTKLKAVAAPLPLINVDTDMIIPKQFLTTIERTGLGKNLFNDIRYRDDGQERPDFVLNRSPYRTSEILVAGENFGCGSSREHAPWALLDFGIRCVIAASFADIFYNNCFKNGILPVILPHTQVDVLMKSAEAGKMIEVDLSTQTLSDGVNIFTFEIGEFRKLCLINGLDDIGLTLEKEKAITAHEQSLMADKPWILKSA